MNLICKCRCHRYIQGRFSVERDRKRLAGDHDERSALKNQFIENQSQTFDRIISIKKINNNLSKFSIDKTLNLESEWLNKTDEESSSEATKRLGI